MRLNTHSLLELIDLFEASNQKVAGLDNQSVRGVPHWRLAKYPSMQGAGLAAWMAQAGYASYFPVPQGDEMEMVDLENDETSEAEPGHLSYRCPETFRLKTVPRASVAVYAVDVPKFLNQIADLLSIANVHRRGIATPALDNRLWKLGESRIGPALTPVWLVRELSVQVEKVFEYLMDPAFGEQGLVLTTGAALPPVIRPPRNYRVVSLRAALVDYTPKPCMDMTLLERILSSAVNGVMPSVLPVHYDEVTQVLSIRSQTDTWTIKGERQGAAVKYLYGQAQRNRWCVDVSEILAAAYPEKRDAQSRKGLKMQNIFSGNAKWRTFISNPEKGSYGFNLG